MKHPVTFGERQPPLLPTAVLAQEAVAVTLVRRLLDHTLDLEGLEGLAGPKVVVILGPTERLPWVDGVRYFGRDPEAPELYLPTTLRPSVQSRTYAEVVPGPRPLLIVPEQRMAWPLGGARPLDRARLRAWLEGT